jgi:hypothetical protein
MVMKALWTEEEDEFLRENATKYTALQMAEAMEDADVAVVTRTSNACRKRAMVLDIKLKSGQRGGWSKEEKLFLKDNYRELGAEGVAKALNRSPRSIYEVVRKGDLAVKNQITPWMPSMLVKIPKLGKTIYDYALELYQNGKRIDIEQRRGKFAIFETIGVF